MSNFCPKIVSPGLGNSAVNVVRSTLALPTTAMRGRFAIFSLYSRSRTASLVRPDRGVNRASLVATLRQCGAFNCRGATHRCKETLHLGLVKLPSCPHAG